jgi:hypothetical protein
MPRFQIVCLKDVPLQVRMDAAQKLAQKEVDERTRLDLFAAALSPSGRRYWIRQPESSRP